jgi:hypothetical protein
MHVSIGGILVFLLLNCNGALAQSSLLTTTYSIKEPSYVIVAPRVIRPAEKLRITATVMRKEWTSLMIKALIFTDEQEIASSTEQFLPYVQNTIVMQVGLRLAYYGLRS